MTAPALALAALIAMTGPAAMVVLMTGGGTPLRVAGSVGLGALAFALGRVLLVAAHEAAHALALVEVGRAPRRAGLKTVIGIPFAFVDTSAAWFEPRRRRMAVAAAGPAADLVLAGAFALGAAALPGGTPRQIAFQLALAGYAGALVNLNPLLDRDGAQLLADAMDQPALRARSRARLRDALAGRRASGPTPARRPRTPPARCSRPSPCPRSWCCCGATRCARRPSATCPTPSSRWARGWGRSSPWR